MPERPPPYWPLLALSLLGSALVVLTCFAYLMVLLARTRWLTYGTSIGPDVILLLHVVGVLSAITAWMTQRQLRWRLGWIVWVGACAVELAFLGLNLTGVVWEYQKEMPDSLWSAIVEMLRR